jgi:hypothetical protein
MEIIPIMFVSYHNFEVFFFCEIFELVEICNCLGQSQRPTGRTENDFLPQELMVALRQTALPSEYLGPPGVTNINKYLRPMPPV